MADLKGKKLLILGGTRLSCEIVQQAKELDVYVIVTDYLENSPAKIIADKSFMVSTTDIDAVVNLIKEEKIDGVLTGFIELLLPYYQQICEKAGVPCYATKEQIEIATNKTKFKQLCRNFNVPVIKEYVIKQINEPADYVNIRFPVLIKPIDNTAGRGIFICKDSDELVKNYSKALSFSPCKQVIVERYMTQKEVTIFYTLQDGNIILTAMADRHTKYSQNNTIPLPVAYTFPSNHLQKYIESLNDKVIDMFKSIGLKNGIVFIQSFVEDGQCVFYEMGFRLTSTLEYHILSKINQINTLEMMINFALTGKMNQISIQEHINPAFKDYGCNITFLARPGKIGKITGINEIAKLPEVTGVFLSYDENDVIPEAALGTLIQVIARFLAVTRTKHELFDIMNKIHGLFQVYSESGENMLLPVFDTTELLID
jgi:biotin carboxylase